MRQSRSECVCVCVCVCVRVCAYCMSGLRTLVSRLLRCFVCPCTLAQNFFTSSQRAKVIADVVSDKITEHVAFAFESHVPESIESIFRRGRVWEEAGVHALV